MHLMLFQDFQTTSSHHEFPRWSNHPPCNRSVPPDQTIREGKHLPVPFQYLVSLSHDLLRGPRKHRVRNGEGRCSCLSVTGLHGCLLAGVQVTTGLPVPGPTGSSSSPTTWWAQSGARALPQGSPLLLCLDFFWGLGWTPTIAQEPEEALMEEFTGSEALTKIHGRHLYMFPQKLM